MTRRSFFRSLGIATAAIYLRLAPSIAKAVDVRERDIAPVPAGFDDSVHIQGSYVRYKGRVLTYEQMFKAVALKRSPEQVKLLESYQKFEWEEIG